MKKIPALFKRIFHEHNVKETLNEVKEGLEWVLEGEGIATIKYDGSCTAIINGEFYKRYDAKHGKPVPNGAIKCQEEADPITGHLPCWLKVKKENLGDKWLLEAYNDYLNNHNGKIANGTYEAIGLHFQSNPYNLKNDTLVKHGEDIVDVPRTFEGIREYLKEHNIEGLVFWKDGEPRCKIRRADFGFKWPQK